MDDTFLSRKCIAQVPKWGKSSGPRYLVAQYITHIMRSLLRPSFSFCAEAALWTISTLVSDPVLPNLDECHHYNPILARTGPHFLNHPDPLLFQTHQRARLPRKANIASLLVRAKYSIHVDVALMHAFSSTTNLFPSSFFKNNNNCVVLVVCTVSSKNNRIHP